jgi:hypothetical protein
LVCPRWCVPSGVSPVVCPRWCVPGGVSPVACPQWRVPHSDAVYPSPTTNVISGAAPPLCCGPRCCVPVKSPAPSGVSPVRVPPAPRWCVPGDVSRHGYASRGAHRTCRESRRCGPPRRVCPHRVCPRTALRCCVPRHQPSPVRVPCGARTQCLAGSRVPSSWSVPGSASPVECPRAPMLCTRHQPPTASVVLPPPLCCGPRCCVPGKSPDPSGVSPVRVPEWCVPEGAPVVCPQWRVPSGVSPHPDTVSPAPTTNGISGAAHPYCAADQDAVSPANRPTAACPRCVSPVCVPE